MTYDPQYLNRKWAFEFNTSLEKMISQLRLIRPRNSLNSLISSGLPQVSIMPLFAQHPFATHSRVGKKS